ncbi:MAG: hypothetical protein ABSE49_35955 [Polyangiaceae bacterium]|jgi:hypothetical protein
MGLGARASLAAAILTTVACGSSFSSSPGTDAGSGADVSSADVSTADASTADVGATDAGATDTGAPADASSGTDATDASAVSSYCAQKKGTYDFCADFDESPDVTQLLSSWTTYSSTGGVFSFDTTMVPSPPNALLATTNSTTGVRTLAIHVMPAPTAPVAKQRLEFDFLVDNATGDTSLAAAAVAAIVFGDDVSGGAVGIAFGNGSSNSDVLEALYEGPTPDGGGFAAFGQASAPPPFPTLATWDGRFAIEITYPPAAAAGDASVAPTACAQLYIGAIAQLSPCLALPPSLSKPTPVTSIALGVFSGGVGSTGSVTVGFDDVTFVGE